MDIIEKLNERKSRNRQNRLLRHIARAFWVEKFFFYSANLSQWQAPTLPAMRLEATFLLGDEMDLESLTSDPRLDAVDSAAHYREKMQAGHKLLLGKHGDEIVFYLWLVHGHKLLMNKTLRLQNNQVAIERGFTRKEYRGHGFFVFGLNFLFPLLRAAGITTCLTEIASHNIPMIRTATKIGFSRMDSYYYWLQLPFRQYVFPRGPLRAYCVDHSLNQFHYT